MAGLNPNVPPGAPPSAVPMPPPGAAPEMPSEEMPPEEEAPEEAPEEGEGGDDGNVSPEEQAQYDEFVNNGLRLIYDKQTMPKVLESLKGGGNPISGLANTLVTVVVTLEKQAEAAQAELSHDVIFHAAFELASDLANLQKEAGIAELNDDEVEQAIYMAVDLYRSQKENAGQLDVDGITEDMAELMEADQAGKLDSVLPGATEAAARMKERGWNRQRTPEDGPPEEAAEGQPMPAEEAPVA